MPIYPAVNSNDSASTKLSLHLHTEQPYYWVCRVSCLVFSCCWRKHGFACSSLCSSISYLHYHMDISCPLFNGTTYLCVGSGNTPPEWFILTKLRLLYSGGLNHWLVIVNCLYSPWEKLAIKECNSSTHFRGLRKGAINGTLQMSFLSTE